jgi:tetratricopeptide (TPR) repeat protein
VAKYNIASLIYATDGRIDEALKCSQEVLQLALEADDLHSKGAAYGACGIAFFRKGLFPEAEENLTLAFEMAQKADYAGPMFMSSILLGLLRYETGQYQKAQECCDAALAVLERVRIWPSMARLAGIFKVAAGIRGGLSPALDAVLNFDLQEIRIRSMKGGAAQSMGEIYLHIDDAHMDDAEAWIKRAIETDEQHKMP